METSFESFFGGKNVVIHGPVESFVTQGNSSIVDKSKRVLAINSHNMTNTTIINSFNDESITTSVPRGMAPETARQGKSNLAGVHSNSELDLRGSVEEKIRYITRKAPGAKKPAAAPNTYTTTTEVNIMSRNVHDNRVDNILQDYSVISDQSDDEGSSDADLNTNYPSSKKQKTDTGAFKRPSVLKHGSTIIIEDNKEVNIASQNFIGNTVLDAMNNNSVLEHERQATGNKSKRKI